VAPLEAVGKLLLRVYDPLGGQVLLDGVDLRTLDLQRFHSFTAVVSQEPVLFSRSIADNITFGLLDETARSMEAIVRAAKLANAHQSISDFKDGYKTKVGERGARLSGGQKQRIAIARALITDPRILVLDEATSALDAESEGLVTEALEKLMVGRTTLVIAHRLSTIRDADNIVVLDAGRVVEQGTHAALTVRRGPYFHLVEKQLDRVGQDTASEALASEAEHSPLGKAGRSMTAWHA